MSVVFGCAWCADAGCPKCPYRNSTKGTPIMDAHDEAAKAQVVMPTIKGLIRLWEQAESGKAFADEMMFLLNRVADKAYADGAKAERAWMEAELFKMPDKLEVRRARHLMLLFAGLIDKLRAELSRANDHGNDCSRANDHGNDCSCDVCKPK